MVRGPNTEIQVVWEKTSKIISESLLSVLPVRVNAEINLKCNMKVEDVTVWSFIK